MNARIGDLSAAERNKEAIFATLERRLAFGARVLEIGAGSGVHACHFVRRRPDLAWQTSERAAAIDALRAALASSVADIPPPVVCEAGVPGWPSTTFDVVYGANIAHIMTLEAVSALVTAASGCLRPGGQLCLYGPFFETGIRETGAGNLAFDRALRARGAGMGLRERCWLDGLAVNAGLSPIACETMPADNRLLIWRKVGTG